MIENIKSILDKCGIATWRITETREDTAELYFIKKQLDIPRIKAMTAYVVDVFKDSEAAAPDGGANATPRKLRGTSNALLHPGMDDAEIEARVRDAYYAAGFAMNPFYELPAAVKEAHKASTSDLAKVSAEDSVMALANGLFAVDNASDAFINSAELFVSKKYTHIVASNGLDVSFDTCRAYGEMVSQCVTPIDVEQYRQFDFDSLDVKALQDKALEAIEDVRARARSKKAPKAGNYSILLKGENLRTVITYYAERAFSAMIYAGYSQWKVGDDVQGIGSGNGNGNGNNANGIATGEALNLSLVATAPYSDEGIPSVDRPLLENGILKTIYGPSRFAYYLGIEPTGDYHKLRLNNGSMPLANMASEGVLEPVSFSDFQMDWTDGHFKGEMRLALLHHADGSVEELSGGSINGSLIDLQNSLRFSNERYADSKYEGPLAILIPNVPVAGE